MTVIALIALLLLVGIIAELMATNGVRNGRYNNPNVASQVIRGTIYDRSGRILAMEIPSLNLYVKTDTEHADLIAQIVSVHLNTTPNKVLQDISNATDDEVLVAKALTDDVVARLNSDLAANGLGSDAYVVKKYERTYPAAFHAAQLIQETENVFDSVLYPAPGYDQHITYGNDVHLTIDLDIQYLLDLAVQQAYEVQVPDYCSAFVVDIKTGQMLASTTYPFYDLNESTGIPETQKINRTLVSSIVRPDLRISSIQVVDKVTEHNSDQEVTGYAQSGTYSVDVDSTWSLVNHPDGYTSVVTKIPEENPRYIVYIGTVNPKYYQVSSVLDYCIDILESGLAAQSKL